MSEAFEGLQFPEVKQQIAQFCSFSKGKNNIYNATIRNNRLAVQLDLDRLKQAMDLTIKYGPMPFGGISDVSDYIILASKDGTLNCEELLRIADMIYGVREIVRYIKEAQTEKDHIKELTDTMFVNEACALQITSCISRSNEVTDNASMDLRRIRRSIKQMQGTIAARLASFISKNRSYLQDDIIAKRNDRSVILVKNNYRNSVAGLQYGFSSSGQATYLEPAELIPLNNELQQLQEDEKREVNRILFALSQNVKKDADRYLANMETLGLLDAIFAKAQWGKKYDAAVGKISDNMDLLIERGRHPLIDQSKVVANSYHLADPVHTILITGPNTGGKTVSLKLVGLFTVMHLSGMPLPCASASIPMYDDVYYDIGDNQSISDDLSTFSAHIEKLAEICRKATRRSLVILDELGSGTDPVEGQALASAILDYFRRKEIYCLATTHYPRVKDYGQQYDDIMLASVEFDQINLKPTYRYRENSVGQSNALEIASRFGLRPEIVEMAREFKQQQQLPQDQLMEELEKQKDLLQQQKELLAGQLKQAEEDRRKLEEERKQFSQQRISMLEEARSSAREIVDDARRESEEIIEQLKSQQNYQINEVAKLKHRLNEIVEEEPAEEETYSDEPLQIGDYVRITLTNQVGELIEMDKKNATVLCGSTRIRSSLANLVKTSPPKPAATPIKARSASRRKQFNIECNLIGMRVEEAMAILDKFMDDALLARAPFVRIVHGFGTGALRTAVWNRLKKYNFVKKFEHADSAQGGAGATIVTLKGHD